MSELVIIALGFIFGVLISFSSLNKFNTIAGLSILKNFKVAKTIMLTLGIGGVLLMMEMMSGDAAFHVKPFFTIGTALGGIIFGIGMSILGYCPGTLPISLGQGSVDALIGIVGGFIGGILFTISYPSILNIMGTDIGNISLFTLMGAKFSFSYVIVVLIISLLLIVGALWLNHIDSNKGLSGNRWILTGIGLALLNIALFFIGWQEQPMGASSSYPYIGDNITYLTSSSYYGTISKAGNWEMWFLIGAFLAGIFSTLFKRNFRLQMTHSLWRKYRGNSYKNRAWWAFIGGVLLIFGARMAGGCTSGHIISGGMQFAVSSYIFAIFTFIGFLSTGYYFYIRYAQKHSTKNRNTTIK